MSLSRLKNRFAIALNQSQKRNGFLSRAKIVSSNQTRPGKSTGNFTHGNFVFASLTVVLLGCKKNMFDVHISFKNLNNSILKSLGGKYTAEQAWTKKHAWNVS